MNKFLYRPLKNIYINQKFGENLICVSTDGKNTVIGCDGKNPPAGYQSLYGPMGHKGVDLMAYHGQPVYCACDGVVDKIDTNPKSGLDVRVISVVDGVKYKHIYEHLLGYQPKVGQKMEVGDLVGWADNTGYSSGDHLHFELQGFFNGEWVPIDPMLYMNEVFALDVYKFKKLKEAVAVLAEKVADWLRKGKPVV